MINIVLQDYAFWSLAWKQVLIPLVCKQIEVTVSHPFLHLNIPTEISLAKPSNWWKSWSWNLVKLRNSQVELYLMDKPSTISLLNHNISFQVLTGTRNLKISLVEKSSCTTSQSRVFAESKFADIFYLLQHLLVCSSLCEFVLITYKLMMSWEPQFLNISEDHPEKSVFVVPYVLCMLSQ